MSKPTKKVRVTSTVADAWKGFYHSPEGHAAIADLMVWCNVYTPCEENDPIAIARYAGERNVALRIAQMIGLRPGDFPVKSWEDTEILDRMLSTKGL